MGYSLRRDLTVTDLFKLQDELTQQVVNAIAGSYGALARNELPRARRRPPASLASYDCVLRAYDYLQVHISEKHLAARDCLEVVVGAEPDYVDARAWLAYLYAEEYHHRWNERPDEYEALDRALTLAREAERLDTTSSVAHGALAMVGFFRGDYERARLEAYETVDLSPNNAPWLVLMGTYLAQRGDFEGALPMVTKAISLNPHPQGWARMAYFYDHYAGGRYEEALVEAKRIELPEDFREPLFLAAALGQLGRLDEAKAPLVELRRIWKRPLNEIEDELVVHHAFAQGLVDELLQGLTLAGLNVEAASGRPAPDG